jgi:hypothetical protein
MSFMQKASEILLAHAEQNENWDVKSTNPLIVTKRASFNDEIQLLISLELLANDRFRLLLSSEDENLIKLADMVLSLKEEPEIRNSEKDLFFIISPRGFEVYKDFSELSSIESDEDFASLIEEFESLLVKFIDGGQKLVKDHINAARESSEEGKQQTIREDKPKTVPEVIESYFDEKEYKFQHDEEHRRFVTGFKTDNYIDKDGDDSVVIVIDYKDSDLVRFVTPFLYRFDLAKIPYSLIAGVIAWHQFEYKFLALSLDPNDGECKISIDIPIKDAQLYKSQIDRIILFIRQFVDETYDDLFHKLLTSSADAQKELDEKLAVRRQKFVQQKWLQDTSERVSLLDSEQRKKLSDTIDHLLSKGSNER